MDDRELLAWDMYFGSVVAFQYHPANPVSNRQPLSELADIADQMMIERSKRKWPLLPPR